jgi:hypothetical protein
VVNATPRPLHPWERDPLPLYRNLRGPQGRSGQVRKNLAFPRPGFDHRTVQPLAIPCADDAVPADVTYSTMCCYRVSWFTDRTECIILGDYELVTRSDSSCGLFCYDTMYSGTWWAKLLLKNLKILILTSILHLCPEDGVSIFLRNLRTCLQDWTVP